MPTRQRGRIWLVLNNGICPALSFENSREGFRSLIDRIKGYVPLIQVYALLEVTGHYHRALLQYLQELDMPVYAMHVQKRQPGLLKTDKRDALGLANHLYNQLEKGIQVGDPLQVVRPLAPPTPAAAQLHGMVHHRQELITESTQRKNKLTAICDELFPKFAHIFRDPNGPTALAFRERFPTPASTTTASLSALQEARGKTRMLSDKKLLELQLVATESIGTKDGARQRGLVFEQLQLPAWPFLWPLPRPDPYSHLGSSRRDSRHRSSTPNWPLNSPARPFSCSSEGD